MTSTLERAVYLRWLSAGYAHQGKCAACGCTHDEDGRRLMVRGVNLDSLVCVYCFELEFDCRWPNFRWRRSR